MTNIQELINLDGRTALITGATGGLGSVIADTLAQLGATLILVDRPGAELDELSDSLRKMWKITVFSRECDLELHNQRPDLIDWVLKGVSTLDVLINNAAFVGTEHLEGWSVPFEHQTVETWNRAFEVNLTSVFHLSQQLMPLLQKSDHASVINIGSIYGSYGPDWRLYESTDMGNPAAYSSSKGGLLQFTRWLATSVAPLVRVNAISPGGIFRKQNEKFVEKYSSRTPLGRMGTEDDLRGAVAYLASDLSRYVTGQNLEVDGGWGVW